jgi:hypothetical protein
MTAGGGVPMYTEICAELGEAIATASSAPGIQFHLILSLLFGIPHKVEPGKPALQLPCSTETQRGVNEMYPSANTPRCMAFGLPRANVDIRIHGRGGCSMGREHHAGKSIRRLRVEHAGESKGLPGRASPLQVCSNVWTISLTTKVHRFIQN